jgi:hypothetical protein
VALEAQPDATRQPSSGVAYYAGDRDAAQKAYESSLRLVNRTSPWLKLSDLAFLRGDLETERRLRERFHGHLDSTR